MKLKALFLLSLIMPALILTLTSFTYTASSDAPSDKALEKILINQEKQLWQAWQKHNGKAYAALISDDHIEVTSGGPVDKADAVAFVASAACTVDNYKLKKFKVFMLDAKSALVTYYVTQETSCNGKAIKPAWVSSVYQKRGSKWLNVVFQEITANN